MSKEATLGKYTDGHAFKVDIQRLVETRLIVQASSGGGKTWTIKKLIEEMHGKVQIIVLDPEGDFKSLREKYDFVIAGRGGDIATDPRYAEQLAHKILELRSDLICDLYELKHHERIRFVKLFLEAMIEAPKELWHPVAVILDEAHLFAPEGTKSESMSAVAEMASRGRKRGFFLIAATQRPAKISKDVVAECQNKLIGLGNMDMDRERGAKELGFTDKAKVLTLRDLEPGQFYAVGPAFSQRGANLVQIGDLKTKHQKSGSGKAAIHAPAPTAKVKAQLAQLADLPKEAEQELKDVAALRARVRDLERQLKQAPAPKVDEKAIERAYQKGVVDTDRKWRQYENVVAKIRTAIDQIKTAPGKPEFTADITVRPALDMPTPFRRPTIQTLAPTEPRDADRPGIGQCERKILGFLSLKPGEFYTKVQVGAMTGYRHSSGGFNNALSKLAQAGLIIRQAGSIALSPGADVSGLVDTQAHRLEDWIAKLGQCERRIYELVLEQPGQSFTKQEIGEVTQYSPGSGGFNNALSRLNTLGLIKRHHDGRISLNPEVQGL